jgi:mono/diheme cytochrome c family protein
MSTRLALTFGLLVAVAACKGPTAETNTIEPIRLSSNEAEEGQVLFMRFCHSCHPNGDAGLGPSLHGFRHLSPAVHMQIRVGAGEMPAFHEELDSDDVDAILAFLRQLDQKG